MGSDAALDERVWVSMFGSRSPQQAMAHARRVAQRAVSPDEVALNILANADFMADAACHDFGLSRHEVLRSITRTLSGRVNGEGAHHA